MAGKPLRAVAAGERSVEPVSLLEAVESGDVLAIMKAQRRLIAESLVMAAENTRPQFSNELNKLNGLIAAEEAKRSVADGSPSAASAEPERRGWDPEAI